MVALARIVDEIYRPSCGFSRRNVEKWVERVSSAVGNTGLQVCDLKPLAELLGCEADVGSLVCAVKEIQRKSAQSFLAGKQCARRELTPRHTATHTLLHAGELYREVTILLHTEQLVAWRTADGQEYSAPAHQVVLDPDEDGLAAAILSRIAGVEIAPEHMTELRSQMAGGVK